MTLEQKVDMLIGMMQILLGKSESPKMASDEAKKVLAKRAKVFKMEADYVNPSSKRQT